ncbi:nucleotidyl transferase AbiEii/AbiGii toxin family protein [Streptomyces mangrovisoli]|nr:nucleotidyl transferase AbiEii/AbiGii toxin family protein [Streptomyces mangrovisoli]
MDDPTDPRPGAAPAADPGEPLRRLAADVLTAGAPYGLALSGQLAALAHGLVDRAGPGVDLATESPADMAAIVDALLGGLTVRGWQAREVETEPLGALLSVTDPVTEERRAVSVAKETFWRPPVPTPFGPVVSVDDVVGTAVRALADRGLARDLVDAHAAAAHWSHPELEELGRRHAPDSFDLADLQSRLTGLDWIDDREFTACGLPPESVPELRRWAQDWANDIAERLMEGEDPEEDERLLEEDDSPPEAAEGPPEENEGLPER